MKISLWINSIASSTIGDDFINMEVLQGRSKAPSNQALEGVKLLQLFRYFWYKFFDVKCFIFENFIP